METKYESAGGDDVFLRLAALLYAVDDFAPFGGNWSCFGNFGIAG